MTVGEIADQFSTLLLHLATNERHCNDDQRVATEGIEPARHPCLIAPADITKQRCRPADYR